MLLRDTLLLYGKNERLLKVLKDILTEFDVYVVTNEEDLMHVYEAILPDFVVIAADKSIKNVDVIELIEQMKSINKDVQIIISKDKNGVKDIKIKTLNILKDIEREVERVSTKQLRNKLYRLELEIASLREQQVMLTAQLEQLKIEVSKSHINIKNLINRVTKGGLLSYNAVSILIMILSAIKNNSSTFVQLVVNNPIPFAILSFGIIFTLFIVIPNIYKKITKQDEKNYLYKFTGINKEVYEEIKKEEKKKYKRRFI